jgi:isochorismate synthase
VGLWLGATPETLLRTSGNRLSTMALAGTQPYINSTNVAWGTKEQEEQQMVVDYIVDSLKTSAKNIVASETMTVKAGNLLHLKTQITAKLESSNPMKLLIKSLHPTPAICGLPRENAKQFILDNENYKRAYYTGFLGELNIKETFSRNRNKRNIENSAYSSVKTVTNLFVNLRCMQVINGKASIYVGGGITKDSIPESEWEETINKTNTMKKVL